MFWPLVRKMVASSDRLIIGSAILPEAATEVTSDRVAAVWLVADDELLVRRIRDSSGYGEKPAAERELIDKFVNRAVAFNRNIKDAVERCRLLSIDADGDL